MCTTLNQAIIGHKFKVREDSLSLVYFAIYQLAYFFGVYMLYIKLQELLQFTMHLHVHCLASLSLQVAENVF